MVFFVVFVSDVFGSRVIFVAISGSRIASLCWRKSIRFIVSVISWLSEARIVFIISCEEANFFVSVNRCELNVLFVIRNILIFCNNLKKQDLVVILYDMLRLLFTRDDLLINRQSRVRLSLVELFQQFVNSLFGGVLYRLIVKQDLYCFFRISGNYWRGVTLGCVIGSIYRRIVGVFSQVFLYRLII